MVPCSKVLIQWHLVCVKVDPATRRLGTRVLDAENGDVPGGRPQQPGCEVQQRGLAGSVGPDEGDDVSGRDGEIAIAQRPGTAVPPCQPAGLDYVHATSPVRPPDRVPRLPAPRRGLASSRRSRKSCSELANSAAMPSWSRPTWSALLSQASRLLRSAVCSARPTRRSVPAMNVP